MMLTQRNGIDVEAELCKEIFKTFNDLNPPYMKELFQKNSFSYNLRSSDDLLVPRVNQTIFGLKSIRYEGAVLWNHLPKNIKSSDTLGTFKMQIKSWTGPQCKCSHCKFVNDADTYS